MIPSGADLPRAAALGRSDGGGISRDASVGCVLCVCFFFVVVVVCCVVLYGGTLGCVLLRSPDYKSMFLLSTMVL